MTTQLDEALWVRRFRSLLVAVTLGRLAFAALAPIDLSPDEAYYWDWSRRLDYCYFSKPPMVAWVVAASTRLFGSSTFTVRLPAVLLGSVTLWAIFALGRRIFGARAGFLAALASLAGPGSCALGLLMTIDPPLVAFWSLTALLLWRATEDGGTARSWIATALAFAGGILSKATMLAYFVLWPFLLRGTRARATLALLPPLFGALAVASILVWNANRDWVMFAHSASHFTGERAWLTPSTFAEFLGSQLGLVSPILFVLLVAVLGACLRRGERRRRPVAFLALLSGVPLVAIVLLSLHQRVHPNWSAPFYSTGFVLLGAWAAGALEGPTRLRGWFRPGLGVGFLLVALTYAFPIAARYTPLGGSRIDPTARIRGWSELGESVGRVLARSDRSGPTFVVALDRQVASELAFYVPGHPVTFHWSDGPVTSQYHLWPPPLDRLGEDALIVVSQEALPDALTACFQETVPLDGAGAPLGSSARRTYRLFLGRSLLSWPSRTPDPPGAVPSLPGGAARNGGDPRTTSNE